MSFPMLRDLVSKMRLEFPVKDVKRMFDMMDLDNDKTLSLLELLGGFEVLFGKFLPEYICEALGVTVGRQVLIIFIAVVGLLTFFAFLALAFSSFMVRIQRLLHWTRLLESLLLSLRECVLG